MRHMEMKDVTERAELYRALDVRSETRRRTRPFSTKRAF
jgi:hypothetical protein